jgi:hypothetical protein
MKIRQAKWFAPVVAVLAVLLIATAAFAAVSLLNGNAVATVNEAITISSNLQVPSATAVNPNGTYSGGTWTVSMYPGETKTMVLTITNVSSAMIPVTLSFTGATADVTLNATGTYPTYDVVKGTPVQVTLTVTADTSAPTGIYTFPLTVIR